MPGGGHRKSIALSITLGSCLVALAITLNIGWIVLNWQTGVLLFFGVLLFALIITGVVLNTVFLVREVRRNEQQDRFINAVTHELKTPVASMRLYLETLQTRQIDDEKRKEFYGVMLAENQRLLRTIDQVLHAGRIGSAQWQASRSQVELRTVVQECLTAARSSHHLPPESLDYKESIATGRQANVFGDLEELKTAVSNLIDNAIKYSGSQVRVLVEVAATDAKHVAIRVRDHGVGIPRSDLKRIFKRFYRIPGTVARRVNGTGLGLFIVRSVAKRHGGHVFAEERGRGSGQYDHPPASRRILFMSRVLIVEDEQHLANGLRFNLEADGYEVRVVCTGEDALALLAAEPAAFDLVVLDVMLPGKDGFAVASELRQANQFVPILMLTARGRPEDVLQGFSAGADDYLPKPFELAILLARIRGLLRRQDWLRRPTQESNLRVFAVGDRTIDLNALELRRGDQTLRLTLMEAKLLQYLIKHEGRTVSRKRILQDVWDLHEDTDTRAIDNFIVRLRRYLEEEPSRPRHLLSVRGVGYRFVSGAGA